ncbi:MAG: serine hydrolase [Oscillospiraceae bacterium]|jgi:D-alanyl-D-alanine carboxypeptidase (penicillin-binding protein 5/6)|nr:serine hydrolase [Oscillospiraceae bacterium]
MKKTSFLVFPLLALILLPATHRRAFAAAPHDAPAKAAVLFEVNSGEVLYEKNMRERRSPDNLVKVMMLLAAARAYENSALDLDEVVTVEESAWDGLEEGRGLARGERMRLADLLYMAYFGVNDAACNAVASAVAGGVGEFVEMMNAEARRLGCGDTKFTNTHGKIDPEQYTTAWDLAVIMQEACRHSLFIQIAGTFKTALPGTNYSDSRSISSPNYMLSDTSKYYYLYATAARTSGTYENGYGLVASARRDDLSLVGVLLGASAVTLEDESTEMQNLTGGRELFEWGFNNFGWRNVLTSSELIAEIPVKYGYGADNVILRPADSIRLLLDNDVAESDFTRDVTIYAIRDGENLTAPIEKGDILGEVSVHLGGKECGAVRLVANTGVELQRLKYIEDQVKAALGSKWVRFSIFLVFALFAAYAALVIRYNRIRRARLRRISEAKRRIMDERRSGSVAGRDDHDREVFK